MPETTTDPILTPELREHVDGLVAQGLWGQLGAELQKLPPADAAALLAHHDAETLAAVFAALPPEIRPDLLAELPADQAAELAAELPAETAADIVNEMAPDDAADVLGELDDKEVSSKIIEGMDDENADDVSRLMTYPEDSAGGIMTTDLVQLHPDQTVNEALDAIAHASDDEHVYQVYVVDPEDRLLGSITIWDLLRQKDRTVRLGDIMQTDVLTVRSDADQAEAAELMAKYDLSVIPVVDDRGYLLGRITHDDATDIIKEEAEEDIFRLAGSDDDELGNVSAWRSCWYRLPWLVVTLLGGLLTATLMSSYNMTFKLIVILAAFIPNVMAMGGNTGLQSSVLMIREIASGTSRRHSLGRLFFHELRTGALMGVICGLGIFACAMGIMYLTPSGRTALAESPSGVIPWELAGGVGFALFCAMTFAAGFGAVVPIVFERVRIDPAVASGPFISVMNDISALTIYYGVSWLLFASLLS